jgi:hypothetical protein
LYRGTGVRPIAIFVDLIFFDLIFVVLIFLVLIFLVLIFLVARRNGRGPDGFHDLGLFLFHAASRV